MGKLGSHRKSGLLAARQPLRAQKVLGLTSDPRQAVGVCGKSRPEHV